MLESRYFGWADQGDDSEDDGYDERWPGPPSDDDYYDDPPESYWDEEPEGEYDWEAVERDRLVRGHEHLEDLPIFAPMRYRR